MGRFNRSHREAVVDFYLFRTRDEVREQTAPWIKEYTEEEAA
jgi:putative transposase